MAVNYDDPGAGPFSLDELKEACFEKWKSGVRHNLGHVSPDLLENFYAPWWRNNAEETETAKAFEAGLPELDYNYAVDLMKENDVIFNTAYAYLEAEGMENLSQASDDAHAEWSLPAHPDTFMKRVAADVSFLYGKTVNMILDTCPEPSLVMRALGQLSDSADYHEFDHDAEISREDFQALKKGANAALESGKLADLDKVTEKIREKMVNSELYGKEQAELRDQPKQQEENTQGKGRGMH